MTKRVLDVGNCGFDHSSITRLLEREFGAACAAADDAAEALRAAKSGQYALVLVNRVFDQNGDSGLALIQTLKADPATKDLPVMMITNYPDHQAKAIAAGAEPGFGKSTLHEPDTIAKLAPFLKE